MGWMVKNLDRNTKIWAEINASSLKENEIKTETAHDYVMTNHVFFQRPL